MQSSSNKERIVWKQSKGVLPEKFETTESFEIIYSKCLKQTQVLYQSNLSEYGERIRYILDLCYANQNKETEIILNRISNIIDTLITDYGVSKTYDTQTFAKLGLEYENRKIDSSELPPVYIARRG